MQLWKLAEDFALNVCRINCISKRTCSLVSVMLLKGQGVNFFNPILVYKPRLLQGTPETDNAFQKSFLMKVCIIKP